MLAGCIFFTLILRIHPSLYTSGWSAQTVLHNLVKMTRLTAVIAVAFTGANLAAAGCTFRWWADKGDTCDSMAFDWQITRDDFIKWNPSVGADCVKGLVARQPYCVEFKEGVDEPTTTTTSAEPTYTGGIPAPTQAGLAKDCSDHVKARPGDTCGKIVDRRGPGLSLADFYKWNPAVGDDCHTLYAGFWYCVAVEGAGPTQPPTTMATTTAAPTTTATTTVPTKPSPTQVGLTEDCKEFYEVEAGDYCYKIIEEYNNSFTLDEL